MKKAEQQQDFYSGLYRQYTTNLLKLVIYVRSLLANQRVREYLNEVGTEGIPQGPQRFARAK